MFLPFETILFYIFVPRVKACESELIVIIEKSYLIALLKMLLILIDFNIQE